MILQALVRCVLLVHTQIATKCLNILTQMHKIRAEQNENDTK